MSRGGLIANVVWMQVGWWACVLGAANPWLLLIVPAGLAVHLLVCSDRVGEIRALFSVTLAGCVLDSLLGALGVFRFDQWPLPLWLALMWLVLASGLRHSLAWAGRPFWRGALAGMLGAPPAYLAGARLTGVELPFGPLATALLLAPVWAVVLPVAVRLAARR